jgi:hypothetical protein
VVPLVPESAYEDSPTVALIAESLCGASHSGEVDARIGAPVTLLSWNFTGMVLPPLKTLGLLFWMISDIADRLKKNRKKDWYFTIWVIWEA